MTTMNDAERAGFEDWFEREAHDSWEVSKSACLAAWQAGAAWQRAQLAVPDVSAMARVLSDRVASACCVDRDDNWAMYGQEYIEDVQAMLASAPTVEAEQVQCRTCNDTALIGDLPIECPDCCRDEASLPAAGSLTEPATAHPAERQEQGEVQRLRGALEEIRHANMNGPVSESNAGCIKRIEQIAERALAASTGQEVEK